MGYAQRNRSEQQDVFKKQIQNEAERWLGTPYCHQAAKRGIGADCLGLVVGVWQTVSGQTFDLSRQDQRHWTLHTCGEPLLEGLSAHLNAVPIDQASGGDVLALRWRAGWPASHVAILMPDHTIIHAYEGGKVVRSPLRGWARFRAAAFSFPLPH